MIPAGVSPYQHLQIKKHLKVKKHSKKFKKKARGELFLFVPFLGLVVFIGIVFGVEVPDGQAPKPVTKSRSRPKSKKQNTSHGENL